ncbi:AfsR/SARP family transcriptional regulator [Nocardia terpenica]|uniref:AfsR/SARP family transcriptional regulator n=1 Tax=Nocardia terpenica TaxID=455432 RepID=UPI002FE08449
MGETGLRGGGSDGGPLQVDVLGPVRVRAGRRDVGVGRTLERAVLVRLALARGMPVPDGRLAVELWGDGELLRPIPRLRVLISRLRQALGEHGAVVSRSPAGYHTDVIVADLRAAEAAADRVHAARRAHRYAEVRAAAGEALRLWRGPGLADLAAVPFAHAEAVRLEEWRLGLAVAGFDAALHLGAECEVANDLSMLAREHPLHEPLARLHALAAYRTGSQADALARLHRLRRALADELGVDPAPETVALELRMLQHDPSLRAANHEAAQRISITAPTPPGADERDEWPDIDCRATLPRPTDLFVGRQRELAAVVAAVTRPGLVTLVGPTGGGKSRLALEVGWRVAAAGRRVVLVELGSLRPGGAVRAAVAVAAGAACTDIDVLAATLRGALLILDGAEHILAEVRAEVDELLSWATESAILVTSQRGLDPPGEQRIEIGPLDRVAGIDLFLARAAGPLTASEHADMATVCAAVDWLPLGIELAAGLTRILTVAQLARRIDARVRLLVGPRGGRHSSLRAALDWSHDLLDAAERAVLRRISVFSGGFALEAAEAVAAFEPLHPADIAPVLAELVRRSMVTVVVDGDGRRFALLETVREYAATALAAAGETGAARQRHRDWFLEPATVKSP